MRKVCVLALILLFLQMNYAQNKKNTQFAYDVEKSTSENRKSRKQHIKKEAELVRTISNSKKFEALEKSINSFWDVQFKRDVEIGSGVETNGYYFYVSQWNNDTIYVYNLNGTIFGKYRISVTGIRDMAYDGTYFYGSNASNKIYKMDFTNYLVIDSITCPTYVNVRHIAYDNVNNAFWVGDWDTDIYLVNQNGQVINTISAGNHNLYGMYGSAYDNFTPGGPYLWFFDQGGSGVDIVMLKISTGTPTGIIHDCLDDVASDLMDPIAGGLFIKQNLISGTTTLGGIIQRQRIFGFDLSSLIAANDVGVEDVLSPILTTGCNLGSAETITVRIRNYGLNSAGNFTLNMKLNNNNYMVNIPNTLQSFAYLDVSFSGTFNFSQPLVYKMQFYTAFPFDDNMANDTGYYNLITGNGIMSVDVLTDEYPEETYWEVYSNFTYDLYGTSWWMDAQVVNTVDFCIDTTLCYGFTIFDAYGDGISPPGYYEIFINGNSVYYDDDFTGLFEEVPFIGHCDYADVGVSGIISPVSSCELSDEEFVTVIVKNYGTQTVTGAEISLSIDGILFTEPLPFTLSSLEEQEYSFVNLCDLSALGNHELQIYTTLNGDMNAFNDTLPHRVENYTPANMPYNVDFDNQLVNSQLLVEDENGDYFTWALYNSGGINNSSCAIYSFNPNEPANDWLYSKCLNLVTGAQYYLGFYYKAQSPAYPEKLKVHLCEAPSNAAAFTQPLIDLPNITDTAYTYVQVPFNVDEYGSGNYYLGFNVYSDLSSWNLFLDNISLLGPANTEDMINTIKTVKVYPNPVTDKLNVILTGFNENVQHNIFIYNIQGQLLMHKSFENKSSILAVDALNKGLYFIRIEAESGTWNLKFVKK